VSCPSLFPFDNSYARLPERFFARLPPTPVSEPGLIRLNESLALHLGLSPERLITAEGIEVLAGNRVPEGAEPLAMAYAGFQFGNWVPQLGDGRAIHSLVEWGRGFRPERRCAANLAAIPPTLPAATLNSVQRAQLWLDDLRFATIDMECRHATPKAHCR
jgi:hypothetical protein